MGIQPVERPVGDYPRRSEPPPREGAIDELTGEEEAASRPETVEALRPASEPEQADQQEEQEAEDGRARGVLRLLREGHFKGVADVRLRINFHEELEAARTTQVGQAADAAVQQLTEEVTAAVDAADDDEALSEGTVEAVRGLVDDFAAEAARATADSAGDRDAFLTGLQDAFGRLTEGVAALATEPPEAPDGEDALQPTSLQNFIEGLESMFARVLDGFEEDAPEGKGLPPLSPPHGNGTAYERFLAIYNSLRGVQVDEADPPPEGTTDVTA
ncbi:MAG: hypothetical protein R6X33_08550 [Candidatus Brocadiia bacterium]